MENTIRILEPMHPYLLLFNYAQSNLTKFLEEEKKAKVSNRKKGDTRVSAK